MPQRYIDQQSANDIFLDTLRSRIRAKPVMPDVPAAGSLSAFCALIDPYYEPSRHTDLLCEKLEAVERGDVRQLIVCMPVRHGKTLHVSESFPAWALGRNPRRRIILMSHTEGLIRRANRLARNKLSHPLYPFKARIDRTNQSATHWGTTEGGECHAAGIEGNIAGYGADILVIDDPIGSQEDADSASYREKSWLRYTAEMRPRLQRRGAQIICSCLVGDTLIPTADGVWRPLSSINVGDFVWSFDGTTLVPKKVLGKKVSGEDETFTVRTAGLSVTGNARHPFLVQDPDGIMRWKKLGDLCPGDLTVTLRALPDVEAKAVIPDTDQPITADLMWFLGFMYGDGWVTSWKRRNLDKVRDKVYTSRSWAVCAAVGVHEDINTRVQQSFKDILGRYPKITKFGYYRLDSNPAGRLMGSFGFSGNAHTKRVPLWVFSCSASMKQEFIRGLMDADGYYPSPTRASRLTSVNKPLLNDARLLAQSCSLRPDSIRSRVSRVQAPHSHSVEDHIAYSINIQLNQDKSTFKYVTLPSDNIRLERVLGITPAGRQTVYDLAVDGPQNFIADGFVVHNTRWHEDDLVGRLLASPDGKNWEVLILPAICEDPRIDPLGRAEGEALWPEWFPAEDLPSVALNQIGIREWNAIYQQRPTHTEGNMFKREWWQYYDLEVARHSGLKPSFTTVDSAFKEGVENDYSVAQTWGTMNGRAYLMDQWREKVAYPVLADTMRQIFDKWRVPLIIEDKASGQSLLQSLAQPLGAMPAIPVIKHVIPGNKSKVSRAEPTTRWVAGKVVYLPAGAPWVHDYVEELAAFDHGVHDDCVDATVMALTRIFVSATRPSEYPEVRYNNGERRRARSQWKERQKDLRREDAEQYFKAVDEYDKFLREGL